MRSDCIRLLVADDLRLGQPVRTSLSLTDEARDRVIDSTYRAWQQIQTLALNREVDAVILNGETLQVEEFSAHAEHALRDGLTFLRDAEIRVLLHPIHNKGRKFWREFLAEDSAMRQRVSLLSGTIPVPFSLNSAGEQEGDEEIFCQLVSIQDHILPDGLHSPDDLVPFTIGINSRSVMTNSIPPGIDLRISGGSVQWKRPDYDSLYECHCSSPQVLCHTGSKSQTESGCLLIEIYQSGEIRVERQLTASVRFLECPLDLSSCSDWDDAALVLQNQIASISWEEHERVRLVTWSVSPGNELAVDLLDGSGVDQLVAAWEDAFPLEDELLVVHGFQSSHLNPDGWFQPHLDRSAKELAEALFRQELTGENNRLERLHAEWSSDEHSSLLWSRLNPHLRRDQISRHAEALMSHWLNTSDPENLPYETHFS